MPTICLMDTNYLSFEKLAVWQESRTLVKEIYILLRNFPVEKKFALCDQIRRAVVSIPSNIAEGSGRVSVKEKIHFLEIAFGSLMESYCQLQIAQDLGYLSADDINSIKSQFFDCSRLISGLKKSFEAKL